ncbi:hypothetical protein AWB81_06430 [Caballeronia arationis]|jgi:hypothetical protein|nr:hypothetical protein [Caballeronia arationis]SAL03487.1 hypothetical protein AWB81_06430 [Caballeronia arationis]
MDDFNDGMSNGAAICYFAAGVLLALSLPIVLKVGKDEEAKKNETKDPK